MSTAISLVEKVRDALRIVIDPELGINIVDLGLVYEIIIDNDGAAKITMTTTTPGCPATSYLKEGAAEAAGAVNGVTRSEVTLAYQPLWSPEMMSAEAELNMSYRW